MSLENIDSDALGHILHYLPYIDRLSMLFVNAAFYKKHRDVYKKALDFNPIIKARLAKYFTDPQWFIDGLWYFRNFISGSFILQCIYDVEWPDSDIDIYHFTPYNRGKEDKLPIDELPAYRRQLFPMRFIWRINDMRNVHQIKMHTYGAGYEGAITVSTDSTHKAFPLSSEKYRIQSYEKEDWLQVEHYYEAKKKASKGGSDKHYFAELPSPPKPREIVLNNIGVQPYNGVLNVFDFISRYFDMDICKNVYDGKKLHIYSITNLIYHQTASRFMLDRLTFQPNPENLDKYKTRMTKYASRGFHIYSRYNHALWFNEKRRRAPVLPVKKAPYCAGREIIPHIYQNKERFAEWIKQSRLAPENTSKDTRFEFVYLNVQLCLIWRECDNTEEFYANYLKEQRILFWDENEELTSKKIRQYLAPISAALNNLKVKNNMRYLIIILPIYEYPGIKDVFVKIHEYDPLVIQKCPHYKTIDKKRERKEEWGDVPEYNEEKEMDDYYAHREEWQREEDEKRRKEREEETKKRIANETYEKITSHLVKELNKNDAIPPIKKGKEERTFVSISDYLDDLDYESDN